MPSRERDRQRLPITHHLLWITPLVVLIASGVAVTVAWRARSAELHEDSLARELELLREVRGLIISNYVLEVDPEALLYGALSGMTTSLDPYSAFEDPNDYRELRRTTRGIIPGGIGVRIRALEGRVEIMTPLRDSPAARAGIQRGDLIVAIDSERVESMDARGVIARLGGEIGTEIVLGISRAVEGGTAPLELEFTLERASIDLVSVEQVGFADEENHVGYLRLSGFQADSALEVSAAIERLRAAGATSLVLDLRQNPGGRLDAATDVVDQFIDEGVIVVTQGRNIPPRITVARSEDTIPDLPLVVLVDGESASASEVVAGALQDHLRAVIVGDRTWGKGSVQEIFSLDDDRMALRLTTKRYLTPLGRSLHREPSNASWGIVPDVLIQLSDDDRRELASSWVDAEIAREQGPGPPMVAPIVDRQLAAALDVLAGRPVSGDPLTMR